MIFANSNCVYSALLKANHITVFEHLHADLHICGFIKSLFPYFMSVFPPIYIVYCLRSGIKSSIYFLFALYFLELLVKLLEQQQKNTLLFDQILQAGWEEV